MDGQRKSILNIQKENNLVRIEVIGSVVSREAEQFIGQIEEYLNQQKTVELDLSQTLFLCSEAAQALLNLTALAEAKLVRFRVPQMSKSAYQCIHSVGFVSQCIDWSGTIVEDPEGMEEPKQEPVPMTLPKEKPPIPTVDQVGHMPEAVPIPLKPEPVSPEQIPVSPKPEPVPPEPIPFPPGPVCVFPEPVPVPPKPEPVPPESVSAPAELEPAPVSQNAPPKIKTVVLGENLQNEGRTRILDSNSHRTVLLNAEIPLVVQLSNGRLYTGQSFNTTIGRGEECAVCLQNEEAVSRMHAHVLLYQGKKYVAVDQNTTNGTEVNGQTIDRGEHALIEDESWLKLANVELFLAFGSCANQLSTLHTLHYLECQETQEKRFLPQAGLALGCNHPWPGGSMKDDAISREHGSIAWRDGSFGVMDANSTNGLYVNQHRLCPGETHRLVSGDVLTLGRQHFVYMELALQQEEKKG